MSFTRIFDVSQNGYTTDFRGSSQNDTIADRRGDVYLYSEELELALNVALVTGRPLLLLGEPGTGKSSLARNVAKKLNWRYLEEIITSQTKASDLLWKLDHLSRMYDANLAKHRTSADDEDGVQNLSRYLQPGILWKAFDAEIEQKLCRKKSFPSSTQNDTAPQSIHEWDKERSVRWRDGTDGFQGVPPAVVLLDEIDKGDPDLPNNLLHPFGRLSFQAPEPYDVIRVERAAAPLLLITTNRERSLPDAFVRRCVVHTLTHPGKEGLKQLAHLYHANDNHFKAQGDAICEKLLEELERLRRPTDARKPSTAEFLDALDVCIYWKLSPDASELSGLMKATLQKSLRLSDEDLDAV